MTKKSLKWGLGLSLGKVAVESSLLCAQGENAVGSRNGATACSTGDANIGGGCTDGHANAYSYCEMGDCVVRLQHQDAGNGCYGGNEARNDDSYLCRTGSSVGFHRPVINCNSGGDPS